MSKNPENNFTLAKMVAAETHTKTKSTKRYGTGNAKAEASEKANYYIKEFFWNRPIGQNWNFKVGDLQDEVSDYVERRFKEDEPKGFFGLETLAFYVISAIISWCVKTYLNHLFELD